MSSRRAAVLLSALTLALTGLPVSVGGDPTPPASAETTADAKVFVNEIHYANTGVDTGEFIEVAGPPGAPLTGYRVVLYDGDTGLAYATATLTSALGRNGVTVVDYPVEGVQDGPDAVALVHGATVVQLLSWGGAVTAVDGPAAGLTSTDLGVAEPASSPVGASLQRIGTGDTAGDFTWTGPAIGSPGAPNDGQTLTAEPVPGLDAVLQAADLVEAGDVVAKMVPASDPAIERIVEGEALSGTATGTAVTVQDSRLPIVWSGDQQLLVEASQEGDATTLTLQVPASGRYRLSADVTSGSDYGVFALSVDGRAVGNEVDGTGPALDIRRRVGFGDIELAAGEHTITLTAVRAGGHGGWAVGLDLLRLRLLPAEGRLTLTPWRHDRVRGLVPIYGWSTDPADALTLQVDGQDVADWPSLGDSATLVYEARGIQAGPAGADFADGISVRGQKTILHHDVGTDDVFATDGIDISGELLVPGANKVTIFTGADPDDPGGNKDNFRVRNVRLVLADGTVIRDPKMLGGYPINDTVPERVWTFTIPPTSPTGPVYTPARGHVLDTAPLSDGTHLVTLVADGPAGHDELTAKVTVDNDAPRITAMSPADGDRVKGEFVLDATVEDDGHRRPEVAASLDGTAVELGTTMTSDALADGEHTFTVTATDTAGNTTSETSRFSSIAETPYAPQLVGPQDGATGVLTDAELSVSATDPDGDPLDVTFFAATPVVGPPVSASGGTTSGELPGIASGGTPVDPQAVAESDDVYAEAAPSTDLPYQRYDIRVTRVRGAKKIDVSWEGRVAPDREVVLYVYDMDAQRWTEIAAGRGIDGSDMTVVGVARLGPALDGEVVHLLVRARDPFAEIPSEADERFEDPSSYDFSIAWMTDTQYLSQGKAQGKPLFGEAYEAMTGWIKDNAGLRKIVYAAHTGDIINDWTSTTADIEMGRAEFDFAGQTMAALEGADIPNGVTPGNHDNATGLSNDLYNEYFPPARYQAAAQTAPTGEDGEGYYGGAWQPGDNQNHYDLVEAGGEKLIFLYVGYRVGPEEIAWANQVLADHRDRKAVVLTHSYLLPSYTPDGRGGGYTLDDGANLFEQVVLPNRNVFLTLSGHTNGVGLNIKRDVGAKGRTVVEMLANYQYFETQGERRTAFLRLLQFDMQRSSVSVNTYSPALLRHNAREFDTSPGRRYDQAADEFVVPVALSTRTTGFRTDSVGLALRTDDVIGTSPVASGGTATVTWRGLMAGGTYGWYARATDPSGAAAESTVFRFTTAR